MSNQKSVEQVWFVQQYTEANPAEVMYGVGVYNYSENDDSISFLVPEQHQYRITVRGNGMFPIDEVQFVMEPKQYKIKKAEYKKLSYAVDNKSVKVYLEQAIKQEKITNG